MCDTVCVYSGIHNVNFMTIAILHIKYNEFACVCLDIKEGLFLCLHQQN